jgi:peptide/nickel transport system substrate-binding protein
MATDHRPGFTRRSLAKGLGSSALLAAMGIGAAPSPARAVTYKEAPTLAALVARNQLPPLAERLPETPLVVTPTERIGRYGGAWRSALIGSSDANWLLWSIGYATFVRWTPDWSGVTPDVAESYEASADDTVFTFRLRKGMKWSDGRPFTSRDIMFWYEDVLLNRELTPSTPAFFSAGGQPVRVEAPDATTVVFRFAEPNGMFLQRLAITNTASALALDILACSPRHYLERFHKKYNPDVDALARAGGFPTRVALFQSKALHPDRWRNTELPTLAPWVLATPYGSGTRVTARRNPYFYKVDPEGNQLPYLDEVTFQVVEDQQVLVLKTIGGEIDCHYNGLNTINNRAILYENRERGRYRFFATVPAWSNTMLINLNQTHLDPVKRRVIGNRDFRIGLSHAMNRQEIIDVVYVGQGEPWQGAPRANTALYNQRFAKQYTEHDPRKANEYLDRAGLNRRDNANFRLGPDGNRFTFTLEISDFFRTHVDTMDLLKRQWNAVGIDMQYRVIDRNLLITRMRNNQLDGTTWIGGGGYDQLTLLDPKWYFPQHLESSYAPAWVQWYLNRSSPLAEEPPEDVKQQIALYDQVQATSHPDRQRALMAQLLEIAADQFRVIGTSVEPDRYGVVKNGFRNVPQSIPLTTFYSGIGPANPEQFFIDPAAR